MVLVFFLDAFMHTRFYFLNACMMNTMLKFNFKHVLLLEFYNVKPYHRAIVKRRFDWG